MQFTLLELVSGVLLTEWTFIFGARSLFGTYINQWYDTFGIWALMSDVSSILIGLYIAMYFYRGNNILILIAVAIAVQWTHDFLFYIFAIKPASPGRNGIMDLLQSYGIDAGVLALIGDSWMMISSLLGALAVSQLSKSGQVFSILVSLYMLPYAIAQKRIAT
jgi:hypothetical protein